jgi:hypothetical protein
MSGHAKIAMCETCPAWRTNGSAEGTCKRMPNGPHTLGTNYCMQHPANRHLMEPPAKCDEREEPEVTTVKVAYGPQDGGYCSDGSTPKPHCTAAAFVGEHVYDAVVAERDAALAELERVDKERKAWIRWHDEICNERDALEKERDALKAGVSTLNDAAREVIRAVDSHYWRLDSPISGSLCVLRDTLIHLDQEAKR